MNTRAWTIRTIATFLGFACISLGNQAGAAIAPVGAGGVVIVGSPVTLSLIDPATGADVTGTWLPEPGQSVKLVVSGMQNRPTITLICPPNSAGVTETTATNPACPASNVVFTDTNTVNPFLNPPTTSAYPGICTNFGAFTDMSTDFTYDASTALLTAKDCGGMAVIKVTDGTQTFTFIAPQDSSNPPNGVPDIYESQFGVITCTFTQGAARPVVTINIATDGPGADKDCGPQNATVPVGAQLPLGDGFAMIDEYRGFMVSPADQTPSLDPNKPAGVPYVVDPNNAKHVRTNPTRRDVFVHIVNPQCLPAGADPLTSTASLFGGPNAIVSADQLLANVRTLQGAQIHPIGYKPGGNNLRTDQWIDGYQGSVMNAGRFQSTYLFPDGTTDKVEPVRERQVNRNAIMPQGASFFDFKTNSVVNNIQRGLRIIECVQDDTVMTYGDALHGNPDSLNNNAIIYSYRVVRWLNCALSFSTNTAVCNPALKPATIRTYVCPNQCFISTYNTATRVWTKQPTGVSKQDLGAKLIAYYLAMEIGHDVGLIPDPCSSTIYCHHTAGSGDNLDFAVLAKTALVSGTFQITFQVPLSFGSTDLGKFIVTE